MTTLDELRRANLKEQKSPSPVRPPKRESEPTPEPEAVPEAPAAHTATPTITGDVSDSELSPGSPEETTASPEVVRPPEGPSELVERVRASIARKRVHPTGVKATVDMPPELFWRVKRYCRDHSNATVRQVFLDLMIAYLDEEGY